MDKITLHPKASELLFKYYRALRQIFNDVLGHLEIDYLSIALLDENRQLCFFSSRPSIEQNLIEHQLWLDDPCYQFQKNSMLIWNELEWNTQLNRFKMMIPKLSYALSIQENFKNYQVCYSFGLETDDPFSHQHLKEHPQTLQSIGKFCLTKILDIVQKDLHNTPPPHLKIVISNEFS